MKCCQCVKLFFFVLQKSLFVVSQNASTDVAERNEFGERAFSTTLMLSSLSGCRVRGLNLEMLVLQHPIAVLDVKMTQNIF